MFLGRKPWNSETMGRDEELENYAIFLLAEPPIAKISVLKLLKRANTMPSFKARNTQEAKKLAR